MQVRTTNCAAVVGPKMCCRSNLLSETSTRLAAYCQYWYVRGLMYVVQQRLSPLPRMNAPTAERQGILDGRAVTSPRCAVPLPRCVPGTAVSRLKVWENTCIAQSVKRPSASSGQPF